MEYVGLWEKITATVFSSSFDTYESVAKWKDKYTISPRVLASDCEIQDRPRKHSFPHKAKGTDGFILPLSHICSGVQPR